MRRMCAQKGETLTETLAAVLVAVLAILMLTTAVVTSARLNAQARQQTTELWGDTSTSEDEAGNTGELVAAEEGDGVYVEQTDDAATESTKDGEVTFSNSAAGTQESYTVSLSGGDDIVSWGTVDWSGN